MKSCTCLPCSILQFCSFASFEITFSVLVFVGKNAIKTWASCECRALEVVTFIDFGERGSQQCVLEGQLGSRLCRLPGASRRLLTSLAPTHSRYTCSIYRYGSGNLSIWKVHGWNDQYIHTKIYIYILSCIVCVVYTGYRVLCCMLCDIGVKRPSPPPALSFFVQVVDE